MKRQYLLFPRIPEFPCDDIRRDWTKAEGKEYFDWFLGIVDSRADNLLKYFQETITNNSIADLKRIGNKAASELLMDKSWREGGEATIKFKSGHSATVDHGKTLTKIGYSLAADMGCLLATFLLHDFGANIKWDLVTKPKNDMYYLHPVIVGFELPFEPVEFSIVCALRIIDNKETGDNWAQMYQMLADTLTQEDCRQ